mgnify:CR=1 FL=1
MILTIFDELAIGSWVALLLLNTLKTKLLKSMFVAIGFFLISY